MSRKASLSTPEKVTNDVMSNVTCREVLRLNRSSLNPNAQVEVDFTIIKVVVVKEFLGFPLSPYIYSGIQKPQEFY